MIGSDGIFEFLSNIEVFKVIEPYLHESKLKIASEKLVYEAAESWKRVLFYYLFYLKIIGIGSLG